MPIDKGRAAIYAKADIRFGKETPLMCCTAGNEYGYTASARDFGGFLYYVFFAFYFTYFTGVKSNTHALIRR